MIEGIPAPIASTLSLRQLSIAALNGAIVGIVTLALGFMLQKYVFTPIGCQAGSSFIQCANAGAISHNVALLFGAIVGLTLLVRSGIFRPLLAVIAVVISLWGVVASVATGNWVIWAALMTLLFGLMYSLFVWLIQPRRFWVAVVLVVVAVVMLRLTLLL